MNIELLKEKKELAEDKYREYLSASKTSKDPLYKDLKKVYYWIKKGKSVISLPEAIKKGGVRENYHPNLAIALATAKMVRCIYSRNGEVSYRSDGHWKGKHNIELKAALKRWENGPWNLSLDAPVPIIPPNLRPAVLTDEHYILWQVDNWTTSPSKDPYLLRRLSPTMFLILAAWDLTDIEMAVMAGRIS